MIKVTTIIFCLVLSSLAKNDPESFLEDSDLPPNYQSFSASKKREILWNLITEDTTSETWPWAIDVFKMLFWDLKKIFDVVSDERPYAPRVAHVVGAYVKAKYVPVNNTYYTGMYKSGAQSILRFSTALEANSDGMCPAMAVKMFRDGKPSSNFAAMYTFGPTPGPNFFAHSLCTHGPRKGNNFALQILAWAFDKIGKVSSSFSGTLQVANMTSNGTSIPRSQVKVPFAIILQPNPILYTIMDGYTGTDVMYAISKRINKSMIGQVGYKVLAVTGPYFPTGDKIIHIGNFVFESEITTSLWGDQKMFFQQQMFEDELELMPSWKREVDEDFLEDEGLPYKYEKYLPPW